MPSGLATVTPVRLIEVPTNAFPVVIPKRLTLVTGPRPSGKLLLLPILILPLASKSRLLLSTTSTLPLSICVVRLLLEPIISTVWPRFFWTSLLSAALIPKPKVVTSPMAVFISPIFAAFSSLFTSVRRPPLNTPLICWSPASIPLVVKLGPPAMVRPSLLTSVSPVFTLPSAPRLTFSASFTTRPPVSSASTPILAVVRSLVAPPVILRVWPSLRVAIPVSPVKVRPRSMTLEIPPFNCATFTASLSLVPAARLIIWRLPPLAPLPTETAPDLAPLWVFVIAIASAKLTPVGM